MVRRPQCPDCGNYLNDGEHDCQVPLLVDALGFEPSERENRLLCWLAGKLDREQAAVVAGLFRKCRGAAP